MRRMARRKMEYEGATKKCEGGESCLRGKVDLGSSLGGLCMKAVTQAMRSTRFVKETDPWGYCRAESPFLATNCGVGLILVQPVSDQTALMR